MRLSTERCFLRCLTSDCSCQFRGFRRTAETQAYNGSVIAAVGRDCVCKLPCITRSTQTPTSHSSTSIKIRAPYLIRQSYLLVYAGSTDPQDSAYLSYHGSQNGGVPGYWLIRILPGMYSSTSANVKRTCYLKSITSSELGIRSPDTGIELYGSASGYV